jgi:septum formation inhibitor MinC
VSSQIVPEQSSSGNATTIFESNREHDPLLIAHTILKEKDDEIHRLRQELEEQKQEVEAFPTTDTTISYNSQIDQEKEDIKNQVRELKQLLQYRFITFHSMRFENELRTCIMSTGYYKIYFNERMEMTKITS